MYLKYYVFQVTDHSVCLYFPWVILLNSALESITWVILLNSALESITWVILLNSALESITWVILLNSALESSYTKRVHTCRSIRLDLSFSILLLTCFLRNSSYANGVIKLLACCADEHTHICTHTHAHTRTHIHTHAYTYIHRRGNRSVFFTHSEQLPSASHIQKPKAGISGSYGNSHL